MNVSHVRFGTTYATALNLNGQPASTATVLNAIGERYAETPEGRRLTPKQLMHHAWKQLTEAIRTAVMLNEPRPHRSLFGGSKANVMPAVLPLDEEMNNVVAVSGNDAKGYWQQVTAAGIQPGDFKGLVQHVIRKMQLHPTKTLNIDVQA